nr:protein epidermal patterning factor 1 [Tanacetum cinerariifolium]
MNPLLSLLLLISTLLLIGIIDTHGFQAQGARVVLTSHRPYTLQIAGSRLPECMHACGACSPCRLVRVRFICAVGPAEAETCPVAYKCMCSNRTYHVP